MAIKEAIKSIKAEVLNPSDNTLGLVLCIAIITFVTSIIGYFSSEDVGKEREYKSDINRGFLVFLTVMSGLVILLGINQFFA